MPVLICVQTLTHWLCTFQIFYGCWCSWDNVRGPFLHSLSTVLPRRVSFPCLASICPSISMNRWTSAATYLMVIRRARTRSGGGVPPQCVLGGSPVLAGPKGEPSVPTRQKQVVLAASFSRWVYRTYVCPLSSCTRGWGERPAAHRCRSQDQNSFQYLTLQEALLPVTC